MESLKSLGQMVYRIVYTPIVLVTTLIFWLYAVYRDEPMTILIGHDPSEEED